MRTYLYGIFSTLNINSNIHHLEAEQLSIPYYSSKSYNN